MLESEVSFESVCCSLCPLTVFVVTGYGGLPQSDGEQTVYKTHGFVDCQRQHSSCLSYVGTFLKLIRIVIDTKRSPF